jgi:phage shock protein A
MSRLVNVCENHGGTWVVVHSEASHRCPVCALDTERDELRNDNDDLRGRLAALKTQVEQRENEIRQLEREAKYEPNI